MAAPEWISNRPDADGKIKNIMASFYRRCHIEKGKELLDTVPFPFSVEQPPAVPAGEMLSLCPNSFALFVIFKANYKRTRITDVLPF